MDRRSFWDWFLNRKPKETFNYREFEQMRLDNPLLKKLEEDVARSKRTHREIDNCYHLSTACGRIVIKYMDKLPYEDYSFFMLYKGHTAFLPLSIKEYLQPLDMLYFGRVGSLTAHID